MHLVLASRSSRRADLLTSAGFEFELAPADIDEQLFDGETATDYVSRLARDKAAHVAKGYPDSVVLGADTVVVVDDAILGKPVDALDASRMLHELSGRDHKVLTGVALQSEGEQWHEVESTLVRFRELSAWDIAWYVRSGESLGKAGAYAIQGLASRFVIRIEGSYSNVVGLPVAVTDRMLRTIQRPRRSDAYVQRD